MFKIVRAPNALIVVISIVVLLASAFPTSALLAQSTLPADENAMALPIYPSSTGDFDEMKKDRRPRIAGMAQQEIQTEVAEDTRGLHSNETG